MSKRKYYGLSGNSGFVATPDGMVHVNANYDSNKKVFVETRDGYWRRESRKRANPEKIIRCSYCKRPAVSLDHCWPYLQEATTCAVHFGQRQKLCKGKR